MWVIEATIAAFVLGWQIQSAERQSRHTPIRRRVSTAGAGLAAIYLTVAATQVHVPVVLDVSAVVHRLDQSGAVAGITLTKWRECDPLGFVAQAIDRDGVRHPASLRWIGDDGRMDSKQPGHRYRLEDAAITWDAKLSVDAVQIVATHTCGWGMPPVSTTLGPWPVH